MFLLAWAVVGLILMTAMIVCGHKLADIENNLLRRLAMLAVTVISWPAFAALTAIDYFLQFLDGDVQSAKEAIRKVFRESTIGLYHDIKEAW